MLKYMRFQVRAQISKRTEVIVLANLADFKNDPKSRILENAYLKYTFNPKLAFTVGQFRPWFGIEETYPIDIIKSLDWSNQYTEFGKLGWTSFQIGLSATGQFELGGSPFQYAVSVVNGNGKNQVNDNDNGKQYSTRLVFIFASATAHVAAMYAALLGVGLAVGIPPMLLAIMLGFLVSIYGVLTHYGHGIAPVFFGSGYVDLKVWWLRGLGIGVVLLIIYMGIDGLWMEILGYY